jgi:hypothetical protein
VIAIDRARRIAALTVVAHRLHHGTRLTHWWWAARLRRLALAADDEMVDDARTRVTRVHRIAALTAPNSGSDSVVRQSDTESDSRDSARDSVALRSAAVALVSDLLQQGASVSGAEIGRQFGQPPRWGQRRVSDAREAVAAASNGHKPVSVKG